MLHLLWEISERTSIKVHYEHWNEHDGPDKCLKFMTMLLATQLRLIEPVENQVPDTFYHELLSFIVNPEQKLIRETFLVLRAMPIFISTLLKQRGEGSNDKENKKRKG